MYVVFNLMPNSNEFPLKLNMLRFEIEDWYQEVVKLGYLQASCFKTH